MNKTRLIYIGIIFAMAGARCFAQDLVFDERGIGREFIRDEKIKTIQIYREGWKESYPILTTMSDVTLNVEFDELADQVSTFCYTIIHCNADWTRSELLTQEYIEGYDENVIDAYENSFNTYFNYTHYSLQIPSESMRLTRSGNYLLVVYRDYDRDDVVFTRRFMISEAAVNIDAEAKRPVLTSFRDCCQEIDFTIRHSNYRIDDPRRETFVAIFQNGVWDNEISGLKPLFINPGELIYDYQEENVFQGGNEFRMFETKNSQVRGYHIDKIEYIAPYLHFGLKTDEPNPPHLYFSREDMDGRFYIDNADGRDPKVDADYVFVHFTLKSAFEFGEGDVYITGALTDWQFNDACRMEYDAAAGAYLGTLLLKQGIYNYRYIFLPADEQTFDVSEIEGSHFETENEYLILFYHRPPGARFDHLVGHQVIRSGDA